MIGYIQGEKGKCQNPDKTKREKGRRPEKTRDTLLTKKSSDTPTTRLHGDGTTQERREVGRGPGRIRN